ncbi:hypothetical protein MJG53_017021 [Ovis ammon polii x Ovis aries]|uniref:Uncharacterized protein n=1 Tax=Ovis ammon polii x Ovis aries TaxID=2918886 RepID=A0ACB9UA69_9CETA|nr:hypothetical protein MJG53_017021 [Ovis ammon polii x Ovis aries]
MRRINSGGGGSRRGHVEGARPPCASRLRVPRPRHAVSVPALPHPTRRTRGPADTGPADTPAPADIPRPSGPRSSLFCESRVFVIEAVWLFEVDADFTGCRGEGEERLDPEQCRLPSRTTARPCPFHGAPAALGLCALAVLRVGDAIDNHRSFHDKHGLAGKRGLEPEDEARPGSFDRPLADNNVVHTIIEFLTFLHLKELGCSKRSSTNLNLLLDFFSLTCPVTRSQDPTSLSGVCELVKHSPRGQHS